MIPRHYYNEIDDYAASWIEALIAAGHLPPGEVDRRSIVDVDPADLAPFTQCHFFAGIAGWSLAAKLAGWPDDLELWTGSPPCQPFSVAGKQRGTDDERHLWPHLFRLLRARRPACYVGEQVAAAARQGWLDGVLADLESIGYAGRAVVVPACAVDAPHRRDRVWIAACAVADPDEQRAQVPAAGKFAAVEVAGGNMYSASAMVNADSAGSCARIGHGEAAGHGASAAAAGGDGGVRSAWTDHIWIIGHDGKARRIPEPQSGIHLLAHGVPARVGRLRAYGNAIVPQVAAEVLAALMETMP